MDGHLGGAESADHSEERFRLADHSLVEPSQALLRAALDAALDAIITIDERGLIIEFNHAAENMFGFSRNQVVGKQMAELLIPPSLRDSHYRGFARFLTTGEGPILGTRVEVSALRADGSEFPVELSINKVALEGETLFTGYVRDLSEREDAERLRVQIERALRLSEESYRRLFDSHPVPMWVFDPDTLRFLAVNRAAIATYGYSRVEFMNMTIEDVRPNEDLDALHHAVADPGRGRVDAGTWTHQRKDGSPIKVSIVSDNIEFEGRPARVVLATDITEKDQLEKQLRQSQKVEAIGSLAGGIAHDFNNILTGIRGYSAFLLDRLEDGELRREVSEIIRAAESAAQLTNQLLAFSRQQVLHPKITKLNEMVRDGMALLERVIGENIELVARLSPDVGTVFVDRGQLTQVVLNLAINARDAMPDGGTLIVNSTNVALDEEYADAHHGVTPGSYVLLQISDTGVGMDETIRNRIFDPFFTTKKQGTGLGLSTVHGIIKQSGGHIWVYSEPGKGTTFKIYLPRSAAPQEPEVERTEPAQTGRGETVLIVEDSSLLRPLVERILGRHGYNIIVTSSAEEAIEAAAAHPDRIDLLLTDVVLPGKNGRELAAELVSTSPDMKVLFTSGYPADVVVRQGIKEGTVSFIEKPYAPSDLVTKVRETLQTRD
jgi:PAS domain S-box-containing protein